jgi:hypothetical protein
MAAGSTKVRVLESEARLGIQKQLPPIAIGVYGLADGQVMTHVKMPWDRLLAAVPGAIQHFR